MIRYDFASSRISHCSKIRIESFGKSGVHEQNTSRDLP